MQDHTGYYDNYGKKQVKSHYIKKKKPLVKSRRRKSRLNPVTFLIAVTLLGLYGFYVAPYNYKTFFEPLILNRYLNQNLHLDVSGFVNNLDYIHNSFILDSYVLADITEKPKDFNDIKTISEMTLTKQKLLELFKKYPKMHVGVFVWDYSTGFGIDINSNDIFPVNDIIKVPLVFELIKTIEESSKTKNPINLSDKRKFDESFKALNYSSTIKQNSEYSLDYLINEAMSNSDNTASNMLLYEIGGLNGLNRLMRNIGLKKTLMNEWFTMDYSSTTTPYEISKILYNIDNPNYIDTDYKNVLKEYLGNTKNAGLIQGKLPKSAMVLNKSDVTKTMVGDCAVVYTDNGKKYIITILIKRPPNDLKAKTLIQEASLIIYNDIKEL